jgi:hypothetical protein
LSQTTATTQMIGVCPCDAARCEVVGTKLNRAGHVVGCVCPSCLGKRNRKAGQEAERRRHKRLGGVGGTPHDELATSYSLNVTTQDKHGAQVPAAFVALIDSKWFHDAMRQAEKKLPVGSNAMPSVYLEPPRRGSWLVVRVPSKGLR